MSDFSVNPPLGRNETRGDHALLLAAFA